MKIISTIDNTAEAQGYWSEWRRRITCGLSTGGCGTVYEVEAADLEIVQHGHYGRTHNAYVHCPVCGRQHHIQAPNAMVLWLKKRKDAETAETAETADEVKAEEGS